MEDSKTQTSDSKEGLEREHLDAKFPDEKLATTVPNFNSPGSASTVSSVTSIDSVTSELYIGNTNRFVTAELLSKEFSEYGEVISVELKKSKSSPSYGFVKMRNRLQARLAKNMMNGRLLCGNVLEVSKSIRNTKLLVVGFPIDVSIDEIRNLFSRCGKLEEKSEEDCTLDFRGQITGPRGLRHSEHCYINFRYRGDAVSARHTFHLLSHMEAFGRGLRDGRIEVDWFNMRAPENPFRGTPPILLDNTLSYLSLYVSYEMVSRDSSKSDAKVRRKNERAMLRRLKEKMREDREIKTAEEEMAALEIQDQMDGSDSLEDNQIILTQQDLISIFSRFQIPKFVDLKGPVKQSCGQQNNMYAFVHFHGTPDGYQSAVEAIVEMTGAVIQDIRFRVEFSNQTKELLFRSQGSNQFPSHPRSISQSSQRSSFRGRRGHNQHRNRSQQQHHHHSSSSSTSSRQERYRSTNVYPHNQYTSSNSSNQQQQYPPTTYDPQMQYPPHEQHHHQFSQQRSTSDPNIISVSDLESSFTPTTMDYPQQMVPQQHSLDSFSPPGFVPSPNQMMPSPTYYSNQPTTPPSPYGIYPSPPPSPFNLPQTTSPHPFPFPPQPYPLVQTYPSQNPPPGMIPVYPYGISTNPIPHPSSVEQPQSKVSSDEPQKKNENPPSSKPTSDDS